MTPSTSDPVSDIIANVARRDILKLLAVAGSTAGLDAAASPPDDEAAGGKARGNDDGSLPEWSEFVEMLKSAGELNQITLAPDDDQLRMELYRQFIMNIALGYFLYFQADARYPDWLPFLNSAFLLQPNPDDVYHIAAIDDQGTYRIRGVRGSVHILLFSLGKEAMGTTEEIGGGFGQLDAQDLELGPNGEFEFILSPQRPPGYGGRWWQLPAGAKTLLSRQRSYNWGIEADARFSIVRLDMPADEFRPRMPAPDVAQRVADVLGGYAGRLSKIWLAYQNNAFARMAVNTIEITDFNNALPLQAYLQGVYRFEADEALILETDVPQPCRYWNFQIADSLWNAVEVLYRQSSLNGHQATLDSDGRFRAVISLRDPGVPNWLDTGGYCEGMLIGRWFGAREHPLPTLKRVKLADVRAHLPNDTPTITPDQRLEHIRTRVEGGQLRRRW